MWRRTVILLSLACTAALAGCASSDTPTDLPTGVAQPNNFIVLSRVYTSPLLDGQLNEKVWDRAARVSGFFSQDGRPSTRRTAAWITYDDSAIYIGFHCREDNLSNLVALAKGRDGAVEQDDSVQVLIVPDIAGEDYRAFGVSVGGVQWDADAGGTAWNADWATAALVRPPGRWVAEMKIPFAALGAVPRPGDTWRILLVRNIWTGTPEVSTHLHVGGNLWATDQYARVRFE